MNAHTFLDRACQVFRQGRSIFSEKCAYGSASQGQQRFRDIVLIFSTFPPSLNHRLAHAVYHFPPHLPILTPLWHLTAGTRYLTQE